MYSSCVKLAYSTMNTILLRVKGIEKLAASDNETNSMSHMWLKQTESSRLVQLRIQGGGRWGLVVGFRRTLLAHPLTV